MIKELMNKRVGDRVYFKRHKKPYIIMARRKNVMIATKKMFGKIMYSIIDLDNGICGPDDYLFNVYEYDTKEVCERALKDMENGEFEISHRHRAYINDVIER